MIRRKHFI